MARCAGASARPGAAPGATRSRGWRGNLAKFAYLRDQINPERMFCNLAMQQILYPAPDAH